MVDRSTLVSGAFCDRDDARRYADDYLNAIGCVFQFCAAPGGNSNGSSWFSTRTDVRRIIDWQVKNRLLAVPGVTPVVVFGGDVRQYQVLVNPVKLKPSDITLNEVTEAIEKANVNASGGFLTSADPGNCWCGAIVVLVSCSNVSHIPA